MPHSPRVKDLALQLDPDCWISYSDKSPGFKASVDARRCASLKYAQETIEQTDAYLRRVMLAHRAFGPEAGQIEFNNIMEEIKVLTNVSGLLEEVREQVRAVMDAHGRAVAVDVLDKATGGRAHTVPQLRPNEWLSVIRACKERRKSEVERVKRIAQSWVRRNPSAMPPLKIKMMLHFGTTLGPYAPEPVRTSPAYTTFVKELLRDGMIERPSKEQRAEYPGWAYKATMKGQCYIKALTDVPLPVRTDPVWTMPIK